MCIALDTDLALAKHQIAFLSKSALTGTRAQRWAVRNSIPEVGLPSLLKYAACSIRGGDDGSNQEAHIRSKGSADAEATGGGSEGRGNPEAKRHRRKGCCDTQEKQEGPGQIVLPA